ncbi:MAG: formylglycine-generating enzyme family protein [Fibrobacterales bacterium]
MTESSGPLDRDYSISINSTPYGQSYDSIVVVQEINGIEDTTSFCSDAVLDQADCRNINYDSKTGNNEITFAVSAKSGERITVDYTCFINGYAVVAVYREFGINDTELEDFVVHKDIENSFILEELSLDIATVTYSEFETKLVEYIADNKSSDSLRTAYFDIYTDSKHFADSVAVNKVAFINQIIDLFLQKRNNKAEFESDLFSFMGTGYEDSKTVLRDRFYSGDYELVAHNGIAEKLESQGYLTQDSMIFFEAARLFNAVGDLSDTSFEKMTITTESDSFSIGNFEVTNELWQRFYPDYEFDEGTERYPVVNVSFFDVAQFCNELSKDQNYKIAYQFDSIVGVGDARAFWNSDTVGFEVDSESGGFRLPTELEWEVAYSKRNSGNFFWTVADSLIDNSKAYESFVISGSRTDAVNSVYPSMANLYNMAGNVAEMVQPQEEHFLGNRVVLKGGHFGSESEGWAEKIDNQPFAGFTTFGDTIGFRLGRTGW